MSVVAKLPDGRLHLQHGPINCLCRAWGPDAAVQAAYAQAAAIFPTILPALVAELPHLRAQPPSPRPTGHVAQAMHAAITPYAVTFITPMAAVAGAVADAVLAAMCTNQPLSRAFVNNGGDIAFHLTGSETLNCGLVTDLAAPALDGRFTLRAQHPARGVATSGRACKGQGGRSFSFGIADAVTVLARTAAMADAAATVIANAVDLPGHPAITRRPADDIDPDTDLGPRRITWSLGTLAKAEITTALDAGRVVADDLRRRGLVEAAVLALRGDIASVGLNRNLERA